MWTKIDCFSWFLIKLVDRTVCSSNFQAEEEIEEEESRPLRIGRPRAKSKKVADDDFDFEDDEDDGKRRRSSKGATSWVHRFICFGS